MDNIVLTVAYDGTDFFGWQKTNFDFKKFPSIEEALEQVLGQILGQPIALQAASRTDRGVHAMGQVVNFFTTNPSDLKRLQYSLNALLPSTIRVMCIEHAQKAFHPTLDAVKKEYHYRVAYGKTLFPFQRYTHWHYPKPLDLDAMKQAAKLFVGKHDFRAFRNFRKGLEPDDTVREVIDIRIQEHDDEIVHIEMQANNFLYKMARNIAGTLVYVGAHKMSLADCQRLLKEGKRPDAGVCAPSHGLTLYKVYYQ